MSLDLEKLFAMNRDQLFALAEKNAVKKQIQYWAPNSIRINMKEDFNYESLLNMLLQRCQLINDAGIKTMVLYYDWQGNHLPEFLYEIIIAIRECFDMQIYGSFGAVHESSLLRLKEAGITGYECNLESLPYELYSRNLSEKDSLIDRINTLINAHELGLKSWSGFIVNNKVRYNLAALKILKHLDLDLVSIKPSTLSNSSGIPTSPYQLAKVMAIANLYLERSDLCSTVDRFPYSQYVKDTGACYFRVSMYDLARKRIKA